MPLSPLFLLLVPLLFCQLLELLFCTRILEHVVLSAYVSLFQASHGTVSSSLRSLGRCYIFREDFPDPLMESRSLYYFLFTVPGFLHYTSLIISIILLGFDLFIVPFPTLWRHRSCLPFHRTHSASLIVGLQYTFVKWIQDIIKSLFYLNVSFASMKS